MTEDGVNALCQHFGKSCSTEDLSLETRYAHSRKDTFLRYYTILMSQLTDDKLEELVNAVIEHDSDQLMELYNKGILDIIYNINKSITQSLRSQAGKSLESLVSDYLTSCSLPFSTQVYVKDNVVSRKNKQCKGGHRLDIVIPQPSIGDNITDFIHISCKTTLRERFYQDRYIACKTNILVTFDDKTSQAEENGFKCFVLDRCQPILELSRLASFLQEECKSMFPNVIS